MGWPLIVYVLKRQFAILYPNSCRFVFLIVVCLCEWHIVVKFAAHFEIMFNQQKSTFLLI